MPYKIVGTITYSSTANRTTAVAAINAILAANPAIEPISSQFTAGIGGTTPTMTVSYHVPDSINIETLRGSIETAWQSAARSTTGNWISIYKSP